MNGRAEGHKRKLGKLKILQAEGNADDRHAENASEDQKAQRKLNAAKDQPKNVDEDGSRTVAVYDLFAEGKQTELCKLKALHTDGDTDDRDAPQTAQYQPKSGSNETAKYDPQKIT